MKVGFIGVGIMGRPMAGHPQNGGHTLFVYDLGKLPDIRELGCEYLDAPVSGRRRRRQGGLADYHGRGLTCGVREVKAAFSN